MLYKTSRSKSRGGLLALMLFILSAGALILSLSGAPSATSHAQGTGLPEQTETATATATPGEPEPSATPTATETPLSATATPTATVAVTSDCQFAVRNSDACITESGCVQYSVPVINRSDQPEIVSGTVVLEARGNEVIGQAEIPQVVLQPNATTFIEGTVCPNSTGPGPYHLNIIIESSNSECRTRTRHETVRDTCVIE